MSGDTCPKHDSPAAEPRRRLNRAHQPDAQEVNFSQSRRDTGLTSHPLTTREHWLLAAVDELRPFFARHAAPIPAVLQVSIGFPSLGALRRRSPRIGECWPPEASLDGRHHLFLSPVLTKPLTILATLVHELVHTAVGTRVRHRAPFRRLALALGLRGRMTATMAGPALAAQLGELAARLGSFPHAGIVAGGNRVKQGTRLQKIICPACGYTARTTAKWIATGLPTCPCGASMRLNASAL